MLQRDRTCILGHDAAEAARLVQAGTAFSPLAVNTEVASVSSYGGNYGAKEGHTGESEHESGVGGVVGGAGGGAGRGNRPTDAPSVMTMPVMRGAGSFSIQSQRSFSDFTISTISENPVRDSEGEVSGVDLEGHGVDGRETQPSPPPPPQPPSSSSSPPPQSPPQPDRRQRRQTRSGIAALEQTAAELRRRLTAAEMLQRELRAREISALENR